MRSRTTRRITSTIASRADLENAVGNYAQTILAKEAAMAKLTGRLAAIRAEYEETCAQLDKKAQAQFEDIAAYITLHPEEIPTGRKSIDLLHGTLGYRTGNPSVRLPRGVGEEDMIERLRAAGLGGYVRTRDELDRAAILASEDAERATLEAHGLRIVQSERFFVEIKREEPSTPGDGR